MGIILSPSLTPKLPAGKKSFCKSTINKALININLKNIVGLKTKIQIVCIILVQPWIMLLTLNGCCRLNPLFLYLKIHNNIKVQATCLKTYTILTYQLLYIMPFINSPYVLQCRIYSQM